MHLHSHYTLAKTSSFTEREIRVLRVICGKHLICSQIIRNCLLPLKCRLLLHTPSKCHTDFFHVKPFKNPTRITVWFSCIWSIFCEDKKLQVEALDIECKLLWCQQQLTFGRTLLFTISFGQKAEADFYWPLLWLLKCNRKAVYLPQRGMDIKEEGPINVVTSHLPKMSFIPTGKNTPTKHKPQ